MTETCNNCGRAKPTDSYQACPVCRANWRQRYHDKIAVRKAPRVRPTPFMEKQCISIKDMIDWLEIEIGGIEHARIGGCPIDADADRYETMMLAIQDLLESLL
jgi:hypothetical protein